MAKTTEFHAPSDTEGHPMSTLEIEAQLRRAQAGFQQACYQFHHLGLADARPAIEANAKIMAACERDLVERGAARAEAQARRQAAEPRDRAVEQLGARFTHVRTVRMNGAAALREGRHGADLGDAVLAADRELFALASMLHAVTGLAEHRPSGQPTLIALLGDEAAEALGLVRRTQRGEVVRIRSAAPSEPVEWPWAPLARIARGEVPSETATTVVEEEA